MKWVFLIIIVLVAISITFYVIIKNQNDANKEEANRIKLLNNVANFGNTNIENINNQGTGIIAGALPSIISLIL